MQTEPYQDLGDYSDKAKKFNNDISEILKENKSLGNYLDNTYDSDSITKKMVEIRSLSLNDRKSLYKTDRLEDQKNWYITKANLNNRNAKIWFTLLIATNSIAIIFSFIKILHPKKEGFPIEPLIVIASSILSWMQIKRFQELGSSYNLTAHEINLFRQNIDYCTNEREFSDFVKDSENAFSREHTQWVARKDK